MLKGCDVSHYQKAMSFNDFDFVIVKATEGKSRVDPMIEKHFRRARDEGKLTGFYHYARPEFNSAEAEAKFFLSKVQPYIGESVLALDYEGTALQYGAKWARAWLDKVYQLTGIKPLFYVQSSEVKNYSLVAKGGYPLWVARYSGKAPEVGAWGYYTIYQYTSSPFDRDYFNRNSAGWKAIASGKKEESPEKKDVDSLALEVIRGEWGIGSERKKRLIEAGYSYTAVQNKVNDLVKNERLNLIAEQVIRGEWGNGLIREKKLKAAGYNYKAVQERVNELLLLKG